MIGMNIGEEKELNVTFPEDYHAENLKGKPATFKVTVKEIKEKQLPELDDDFAQDVSDFDTLAEYKDDLKKKIAERKESEAKAKKESEAIEKVVEAAKMDIPQAMIDTQVNRMLEDFAMRLQQQGLSVEQYFQYTGMTADKIMENLASPAYRAEVGTNGNFILMHSVGSIPHGAEIDVPLNYADYYFLEGIMRKRDLESNKKLF